MPRKRKREDSTSKRSSGKRTKRSDDDDDDDEVTQPPAKKQRNLKVDSHCPLSNTDATILEDYDCMLNQTNIEQNNNKFYVIQVIKRGGGFYAWNRWGRVGEAGANSLKGPMLKDNAIMDFEKKFYDKTENRWSDRGNFKACPGKYTLIDVENDNKGKQTTAVVKSGPAEKSPCKLDKETQALIKLIFDNDMFQDAMKKLEIDVKKMPLGQLSKIQIAKGFEVLEKISDALDNGNHHKLTDLSSKFYTLIPHDFGRQRPPIISDYAMLQKKMDLLNVLGDIEQAQAIQKEHAEKESATRKIPHPLDAKYGLLQCDLKLLDKNSKMFKILETYLNETKVFGLKLLEVWESSRHTESQRFLVNDKIDHRKLLWHGTNVAVVVAILKSGLRIMPHSGGRVGKGIYFASECSKSAGYVWPANNSVGIMFLNEVALGKEYRITRDDGSLVTAPRGYDSIVARGQTEPDSKFDTVIELDGHKVIVPQGKPIPQSQFSKSSFFQSEYLVYREDQCRIRYVLKIQF